MPNLHFFITYILIKKFKNEKRNLYFMVTEIIVHFEYKGEFHPTPANFGDILKSFLTVFRFYLTEQGKSMKKETVFLTSIIDPPFTVKLLFEEDIDRNLVNESINWMSNIWDAVNRNSNEEVIELLGGINLQYIKEILNKDLPNGLLSLTRNDVEILNEENDTLGTRAKIPSHILRAKKWKFNLVQ